MQLLEYWHQSRYNRTGISSNTTRISFYVTNSIRLLGKSLLNPSHCLLYLRLAHWDFTTCECPIGFGATGMALPGLRAANPVP
ncbi:MAG: hypothetical protein KJN90_05775, partial [Gammaproteobacteria bacterium]|nr:hypothetical protein [Gammaproteobacteria bacterium]